MAKVGWDARARKTVVFRSAHIIAEPESQFELACWGRRCIAKAVDADLIKPHVVRYRIAYKLFARDGKRVLARGFVFRNETAA